VSKIGHVLPEGRRGQSLAVGLVVILAAILWLGVAAPLTDWYHARQTDLANRQALLDHMAARARALPALRRLASASRLDAAPDAALLTGDSDAIAAATLQGLIQDMASTAGVSLSSEEVLPAVQQGGFRQIGLRIALTAHWPVLVQLLQEIDESDLRLLVDDLEFHAVDDTASGAGGPSNHPPLAASLVVMAFRAGIGDRSNDLQAQAYESAR
jgi:general secretion pathway protein M